MHCAHGHRYCTATLCFTNSEFATAFIEIRSLNALPLHYAFALPDESEMLEELRGISSGRKPADNGSHQAACMELGVIAAGIVVSLIAMR